MKFWKPWVITGSVLVIFSVYLASNNDAIHSIEQEVIKHHQIIEEAKKRIE